MSKVLYGFQDTPGRSPLEGATRLYPGAIPVEDIRNELFNWEAVKVCPVTTSYPVITANGVETVTITDPNRSQILRPRGAFGPDDDGAILGTFKKGYQIHSYDEWLTQRIEVILDDYLQVAFAGLDKTGARAYVSVGVPESITTPEGVEFRPNLLATTSLDGSLKTTYKRIVTNIRCRNQMRAVLREKGPQFAVKHSSNSMGYLMDVREALEITHTMADDFTEMVGKLNDVKVSDGDWEKFLHEIAPIPEKDGAAKTNAVNKQAGLDAMWRNDSRVAPWAGTGWGVVQAVNTWEHWKQNVRGATREERNADRMLRGGIDKLDATTVAKLNKVLATA